MSPDPATVLYIASRSDVAGGEVYLFNVMRYLDRKRFHPIVVLPDEGPFKEKLDAMGVENLVLPSNYNWLKPQAEWSRFLQQTPERVGRLVQTLRARQVRLVHTNSNMIWDGALAARLERIHHVHVAHIEYLPNLPIYERLPLSLPSIAALMGELSTRTIAVSEQVARSLSPPVAPETVRVIHNGIEHDVYDQAAQARGKLRAELGVGGDSVVVAAVGRLHPDKGFDLLVEAAAKVLSQDARARFLIAGQDDDPQYSAALRRRAASLGIAGALHFLGYREDIPEILADSDLFVLSSRAEGGPYVLLEAMAAGRAAVATRCGGIVETALSDGENGCLVNNGDIDGLAKQILRLVGDAQLRDRLGRAARCRVRERFQVQAAVNALMEVYDETLACPRPSGGSAAADLFLQGARELGALGLKVLDLEERLRQVENLAQTVRQNPLYRAARRLKHWLGHAATKI
jgi:glycosyltransferase involved in cell wall biosynthesis